MPHIIVEYANNLPEHSLAVDTLLARLRDAAVATGLFPRQVCGLAHTAPTTSAWQQASPRLALSM